MIIYKHYFNKYRVLIISILLTLISCKNQIDISRDELMKYYETTNLITKIENNKLFLTINNSELINRQQKNNKITWKTFDAYASIGAMIITASLDSTLKIDSIHIKINQYEKTEEYVYALSDVKKIHKFTALCRHFIKLVNQRDFASAKLCFGDSILNNTQSENIDNVLASLLLNEKVLNSEIIGMKIENGATVLYINVVYANNRAQTFLFNFYINSDDKIVGISIL